MLPLTDPRDLPFRAQLDLGPLRFECQAQHRWVLDRLRTFVPWDPSPTAAPQVTYQLSVTVDQEQMREVRGRLGPPLRRVESFRDQCYHHQFELEDGLMLAQETGEGAELGYLVLRREREVWVLLAEERPALATYAARALRELALRQVEKDGGFCLHAGGLVGAGGDGTAILGAKGAGKTSLILSLAMSGETSFLANDRVLVLGRRMVAFPLAIRVGLGTARTLPAVKTLCSRPEKLKRPQDAALLAGAEEAQQFASGLKFELTPQELSQELGARVVGSAELSRVVIPSLTLEPCSPRLEKLDSEEFERLLRPELMTPEEEKWAEPWLLDRQVDLERLEVTVRQLVVDLPAYRLHYGIDYWGPQGVHPGLLEILKRW